MSRGVSSRGNVANMSSSFIISSKNRRADIAIHLSICSAIFLSTTIIDVGANRIRPALKCEEHNDYPDAPTQ